MTAARAVLRTAKPLLLAALTSVGVSVMVGGIMLSVRMQGGVASVWSALLGFPLVQVVGTMLHHLRLGPLARTEDGGLPEGRAATSGVVECAAVPGVGEVCAVTDEEAPADGEAAEGAAVV